MKVIEHHCPKCDGICSVMLHKYFEKVGTKLILLHCYRWFCTPCYVIYDAWETVDRVVEE